MIKKVSLMCFLMLVLGNSYSLADIKIKNLSTHSIYVDPNLSKDSVIPPGRTRTVTTGLLRRDVYIYNMEKKEVAHIRDTGTGKWFDWHDKSFLAYQFVIKSGGGYYRKCMAVGVQKNQIWKKYNWSLEYKGSGEIDYVIYDNSGVTKEYPCWSI